MTGDDLATMLVEEAAGRADAPRLADVATVEVRR